MARGQMVSVQKRRVFFNKYYVVYGHEHDSFLDYIKIIINKNGNLVGYWGRNMKTPYRDMISMFCSGGEILKITKEYLIIKQQ